jgi:hypothetical protein
MTFCADLSYDVTRCMYIIKVEDIAGPLFVFKNYGGTSSVANILQCALLQSEWGQYISDCIFI